MYLYTILWTGFIFSITDSVAAIRLYDHDIQEIYEKYVNVNNNPSYLERYRRLPMEKNNGSWRWEGKDFSRVIAMLEFERFVNEHNLCSNKGLAINALDPEWGYLPHHAVVQSNYDEDPQHADLYSLNLSEKDFDFVMVNQTLEHLYDPILCLENIYKHMKKGGILYFNVPANNIPHSTPFHYYTGYTPTGVAAVVRAAGFKILSIGQWGNKEYLKKMFEIHAWPDYRQLRHHENDLNCPIIAWVFAIKDSE